MYVKDIMSNQCLREQQSLKKIDLFSLLLSFKGIILNMAQKHIGKHKIHER